MKAGDSQPKVIVVSRRKRASGGSHGGSWKIAYADFVTAMMAFFMVLWILGMDDTTKKAIEAYFTDPVGYKQAYSNGTNPIASGNSPVSLPRTPIRLITRGTQRQLFETTGARIKTEVARLVEEAGLGMSVEVYVDAAGLRIDLFESAGGDACFPFGSAQMKPAAATALRIIANELRPLPNPMVLEGHTDAAQFGTPGYTNWELSSDRANAARRILEGAGIGTARIIEVRGMADRQLRVPDRPLDPSNRRIAILLPYLPDSDQPLPLPLNMRS
jgi:chemotaxis protein MotB